MKKSKNLPKSFCREPLPENRRGGRQIFQRGVGNILEGVGEFCSGGRKILFEG